MQLYILKWLFVSNCETSPSIWNSLNPYYMLKTLAIGRLGKTIISRSRANSWRNSHAFYYIKLIKWDIYIKNTYGTLCTPSKEHYLTKGVIKVL